MGSLEGITTTFAMIARSRKCLDTVFSLCQASYRVASFSAIRPSSSSPSVPLPTQSTGPEEQKAGHTNNQTPLYGMDVSFINRNSHATREPTHAKRRKRKPSVDDCIRVLCNPTADNVSVQWFCMPSLCVEAKENRCDHLPSHLPTQ